MSGSTTVPDLRDPRFWDAATPAEAGELRCAIDAVPGLAHALEAGTLDPRWAAARDALAAGAPIAQVAAELGIGSSDLAAGELRCAIDAEGSAVRALVGWSR